MNLSSAMDTPRTLQLPREFHDLGTKKGSGRGGARALWSGRRADLGELGLGGRGALGVAEALSGRRAKRRSVAHRGGTGSCEGGRRGEL